MIYFDNAATTPLFPEVKTAMTEAMEIFGNPASIHAIGRKSRIYIEDMRSKIAGLTGVKPAEIFFTSGGTESLQTVLTSAVRDLGIERILTTPLEHHAVLHNLEALQQSYPVETEHVRFDEHGRIDTGHLEELLHHPGRKTLVVLMHANNETGMLLPLNDVCSLCGVYGALFLSDTVQTIGKYEINLSEGISFAGASAHKFHGPKGAGFLYVSAGNPIQPLILGGGQERTMRSGTENIIGIAGLAKALEVALRDKEDVQHHVNELRLALLGGLRQVIPDLYPLTDISGSLYSVLNIGFPVERAGDMLIYRLDMEGVAVSGGSACASGVNYPSHVLKGLGLDHTPYTFVRFSFSRFNTMEEVEHCIRIIKKLLR